MQMGDFRNVLLSYFYYLFLSWTVEHESMESMKNYHNDPIGLHLLLIGVHAIEQKLTGLAMLI